MRLQRRRFSEPTDVRPFSHGRVDIIELGDHVIGREVYEPGWRWSIDVKPIAGTDFCQYHHVGYSASGLVKIQLSDGTELEIGPEEVFEIPPGHDAWVVGDEPWISIDFESMRTFGKRSGDDADRTLASIVMTDIVDSTRMAAEMGAARWSDLIAEHNRKASSAIDRHRGRLVKTTGDGLLAVFDGAERAVRAAASIRNLAAPLGLAIRAGVHSGEVQVTSDDIRGLAVHAAARIMGEAQPGEILVSATVVDLVDGSGLTFDDAGLRELRGLAGSRALFRLIA